MGYVTIKAKLECRIEVTAVDLSLFEGASHLPPEFRVTASIHPLDHYQRDPAKFSVQFPMSSGAWDLILKELEEGVGVTLERAREEIAGIGRSGR